MTERATAVVDGLLPGLERALGGFLREHPRHFTTRDEAFAYVSEIVATLTRLAASYGLQASSVGFELTREAFVALAGESFDLERSELNLDVPPGARS